MYFWTSCVILAISYLGYAGARHLLMRWRRQVMSQESGCQPIPDFSGAGILGAEFSRGVKASFQDGTVNQTALRHYQKARSLTYKVPMVIGHELYTADPENHRAIATRLDDWTREVGYSSYAFFGKNATITHQNGAAWRQSRDLVVPLFQRAEIKDLDRFRRHVEILMTKIPSDGSTFDIQPWLRKLFLDSSTEFVFGESIDSMQKPLNDADDFITAFNRAAAGAGKRLLSTGLRQRLYKLGTRDQKWLADCKLVHDYVDACITRHRSQVKTDTSSQMRYVLLEGMSEVTPDPIQLRFRLLGIFSLARETSAMAASNVLFLLARNPQHWTRLREQLPNLPSSLSFEHIQSLPSLFRHVILETFRLRSPVTRIRRVAARDTVLPRGGGPGGTAPALVLKGTLIWCDRYPKFRDPEIWGEDFDVFRPERFEGKRLGWEFLPFSGSPRMCPANQLVMTQCLYLLARLVSKFQMIENRDSCLEFVEGVMLCFESRNGCKIALNP